MGETLKALTIHQPYAHLIVTPQSELPTGAVRKRVENRRWATDYRGTILIHAGKSLKWINANDYPVLDVPKLTYSDFPEMTFGAIVGVAQLIACLGIRTVRSGMNLGPFNWVPQHWHTEGPWCWILEDVRRFAEPVEYRGRQSLFDVPKSEVAAALETATPVAEES